MDTWDLPTGAKLEIRTKDTRASHEFLEKQVLGGGILKLPPDAERHLDHKGHLSGVTIKAASAGRLIQRINRMLPEEAQIPAGKWTQANPPGRRPEGRSHD